MWQSNSSNRDSEQGLRLVIPSDGVMHELTLDFLRASGMRVHRPSSRGYTGSIPSVNGTEIVFQRTADISARVEAGDADLGLVGYDRFAETRIDGGNTVIAMPNLGFGRCALVVAVPDTWVDVESMADLADLAVEFQESGRELRIATKYPRLATQFLYSHDVNYFELSLLSGTVEPAPSIGYADLIIDLTASGQTLRENRLKQIADGTVVASEGTLIANQELLKAHSGRLACAREIMGRIEARQLGTSYSRITANIEGLSEDAVAGRVLECQAAAGLHGPTIARVYSPDSRNVFSVTVMIEQRELAPVVDHLRSIGGTSVTVSELGYVFAQQSEAYTRLLGQLGAV